MNTGHRAGRYIRGTGASSIVSRQHSGSPGLMTMVTDVVLAAVWAAMIPGLLWLGVAGGF